LFFLYVSCLHRDLHSFPTRRSSDLVYISEISREVSVVKHFYRSVIQDGIGKQEHRHIGSSPWSVNRKKTQSDSLYIVQMAIGISHEFVAFFGCCIQAYGVIHTLMDRKW